MEIKVKLDGKEVSASIDSEGYLNINDGYVPEEKGLGKYVIVRTNSAGVFAGYFVSRKDREVVLTRARRIWYWEGAASLSQLAMDGTSKPDQCKLPCEVSRVELLEVIEILDCTDKAKKSIQSVKIWKC